MSEPQEGTFRTWLTRALARSSLSDWLLALFTFFLVVVAVEQAVIIYRQLDVMRSDERAWIVLQDAPDDGLRLPPPGIPLLDIITLKNTGKTPALNVRGVFGAEIVASQVDPHLDEFANQHVWGSIGANSATEKVSVQSLERAPISSDEMAALRQGAAYIAFYGKVTYEDVFHRQHWMQFCYWSSVASGGYAAQKCVGYNGVDTE